MYLCPEYTLGTLISLYFLSVNLIGVRFMGVHLTGIHLTGVHLTGVHLTGVHLIGVYLISVHLMSMFYRRDLTGVQLVARFRISILGIFGKVPTHPYFSR